MNKERLWNRLHELSQYGKDPIAGHTRFSFTKEERMAKDLTAKYMLEAGLEVREDAIGNLIGRREGTMSGAPAVLIGSHLDSVPQGGMFDGPLGVLAGIEVLQSMNEREIVTDHPIEVIAFTDEEGSRFQFGLIGSKAVAGVLTEEDLQRSDQNGITLGQAMKESGFDPLRFKEAARDPKTVKGYVEVHIEQGKVLETNNLPIGVVSGIAGPLWLNWKIKGEAGHAGATPMQLRKDPLVAAAEIMQDIEEQSKKYKNAVATVGKISVKPAGVNVIPGEVEFTLDLRDIDEAVRDTIEKTIVTNANKICSKRKVELEVTTLQRVAPVPCSPEIRQVIEHACSQSGVKAYTLPSGAGHDGMQFKDFCPIGMIFVQSKDGISHNPAEWSTKEDCAKGAEVLYHTVLGLANSK
ncbi:Zn-dependent hydrolase [Terrihalobacillus insolitus]|uniref:Zn-dependent hydrolase n=1 Tax=Terrihalobacillus insolitus TaxID=2950438 RepID=UPI00233FE656|nr:Zn-dependent hydrolase [Terrihalobacillus insolitus]MDC3413439.1 Zn-dependent hydrolase [Terrihalobacillus insolitus]